MSGEKSFKKFTHNILFLSETKVNANRSLDILPKIQFECFDFVNPIGFSRGLWLCWNPNVVSLDIILKNNKMFHYMTHFSNLNFSHFFTFFCMIIPNIINKKRYGILY